MIKAGLIDEFFDSATTWVGGFFLWVPDWFFLKWWVLGFLILIVAFLVSWFFGMLPTIGGWLRGLSGAVVLLYAAFLIGITIAYRHYKQNKPR